MSLTVLDVTETLGRLKKFAHLPPDQRIKNWDVIKDQACGQGRPLIEQFFTTPNRQFTDEQWVQLTGHLGELDGQKEGGCSCCRAAFWRMVWINTTTDGIMCHE